MKNHILLLLVLLSYKTEAQPSVLSVADDLYQLGNYTKAIAAYKQHETKEEVLEPIAKAYLALGNYDEALSYYKMALDSHPEDAVLKYEFAKLLAKVKQYNKASELFHQLANEDQENPNFHYQLGLVLEKIPDSSEMAYDRFKKAYELDRTHQKAIYKIAKHHLVKRHHVVVDQYVKEGLDSYANNKELISLKAQNLYWQELYDDAAVWFQKLVDMGESSLFLHEKLGFCYLRLYDSKNALIHIKKALVYAPKNATNLFILAQIYGQEQDYVNAEKYYRESIGILDVPLDDEYTKLATTLNAQDKHDEAIKMLQKAIRENPKNMQARFFLLTTKSAYYEDIDEKIRLHEEFIEKYPETRHGKFVKMLLSKLKEEKFMKKD